MWDRVCTITISRMTTQTTWSINKETSIVLKIYFKFLTFNLISKFFNLNSTTKIGVTFFSKFQYFQFSILSK